jgi:hypothetical protein
MMRAKVDSFIVDCAASRARIFEQVIYVEKDLLSLEASSLSQAGAAAVKAAGWVPELRDFFMRAAIKFSDLGREINVGETAERLGSMVVNSEKFLRAFDVFGEFVDGSAEAALTSWLARTDSKVSAPILCQAYYAARAIGALLEYETPALRAFFQSGSQRALFVFGDFLARSIDVADGVSV